MGQYAFTSIAGICHLAAKEALNKLALLRGSSIKLRLDYEEAEKYL